MNENDKIDNSQQAKADASYWNSAVTAYNGFSAMKSGNAIDRLNGIVQTGEGIAQLASLLMA